MLKVSRGQSFEAGSQAGHVEDPRTEDSGWAWQQRALLIPGRPPMHRPRQCPPGLLRLALFIRPAREPSSWRHLRVLEHG